MSVNPNPAILTEAQYAQRISSLVSAAPTSVIVHIPGDVPFEAPVGTVWGPNPDGSFEVSLSDRPIRVPVAWVELIEPKVAVAEVAARVAEVLDRLRPRMAEKSAAQLLAVARARRSFLPTPGSPRTRAVHAAVAEMYEVELAERGVTADGGGVMVDH